MSRNHKSTFVSTFVRLIKRRGFFGKLWLQYSIQTLIKHFSFFLILVCKSPLDTVIGIQWGNYCGSKAHPLPLVQWVQTLSYPPNRIITASSNNLSAYLCQENTCVLTSSALSSISTPVGILSWQKNDGLLHVHSTTSPNKSVFNPMRPDRVTCCEFIPEMDILFVGGSSGILSVWPVSFQLYKVSTFF